MNWTHLFQGLAAVCFILAVVEAQSAYHWRLRAGHWHGFRIGGVLLLIGFTGLFGMLGAS